MEHERNTGGDTDAESNTTRGHDPLCPTFGCNHEYPDECECELITQARTDEREKAGQRLVNIQSWPDPAYPRDRRLCVWEAAYNAARADT